jgi:hypothetical protein
MLAGGRHIINRQVAECPHTQLKSALVDIKVCCMMGKGGFWVLALCHSAKKEKERGDFSAIKRKVFRSRHGIHHLNIILTRGTAEGGQGSLNKRGVVVRNKGFVFDVDVSGSARAFGNPGNGTSAMVFGSILSAASSMASLICRFCAKMVKDSDRKNGSRQIFLMVVNIH